MTTKYRYKLIVIYALFSGYISVFAWTTANKEHFKNRTYIVAQGYIEEKRRIFGKCRITEPCDEHYFKINDKYTLVQPDVYKQYKAGQNATLINDVHDGKGEAFFLLYIISWLITIVLAVAGFIMFCGITIEFFKWLNSDTNKTFREYIK